MLSKTSSLLGYDDDDIANNFDRILNDMIVTPLIKGVVDKIKNVINNN